MIWMTIIIFYVIYYLIKRNKIINKIENDDYNDNCCDHIFVNKNKHMVQYFLNKNFYTSCNIKNKCVDKNKLYYTDISTIFFYIHFKINVPKLLRIFFDHKVVNYYNDIYRLTSLLYFSLLNLNYIFLIFSTLCRPTIFQCKKWKGGNPSTAEGQNKIVQKNNMATLKNNKLKIYKEKKNINFIKNDSYKDDYKK